MNELKKMRLAEAVADRRGPYAKFFQLNEEEKAEALVRSETARNDALKKLQQAERGLAELKKKNSALQSDYKQAKTQLQNLRESKTMRLGKALVAPVNFSRRLARNPKEETTRALVRTRGTLGSLLTTGNKRLKAGLSRKASTLAIEPQKPANQTKEVEGTERVTPAGNQHDSHSFEKQLNQLWYREGKIGAAAELIEAQEDLLAQSSDKVRILAERILGEARFDVHNQIPARSEGPAYVPEPARVLYFVHQTPVFNSNGYSTRTRGVARGLQSSGLDVVVVARSGYPWDSKADVVKPKPIRYVQELDSIPYVHLTGGNLNRDPFDRYVLQCADAFVREARRQRPSIIQAASNYRTALAALIAARKVGVPFVYEVRGLWEFTEASLKPGFEGTERFAEMRRIESFVASEADRVFAITEQVKDELVARGVPAEKIDLAPNAVDPDSFLPFPRDEGYASARSISREVPVIGFAGSIVDYEGLDVLLEAAALLKKQGVEHQVVIAGSGAAEGDLKKQAAQLGLTKKDALFLGRFPQDEMPRLHSTFDIVCCPRKSTPVTELVSALKPLESFAAGRATVLSDVAPNLDQAGSNEQRALVFRAGDPKDLARVLSRLIKDQDLRLDLGRSARLWVVTERSWARLGERMRSAHGVARSNYHQALRDGNPPRYVRDLRVGVIADEFTRATLESAFHITVIERNRWREQIDSEPPLDMLLVESAWEGNGGQWHRGVGHYSDDESADLRKILKAAQERGITTVFWNKEDPVHFSRFAPNAALFDHVLTTDANMIPRYHQTPGQRNQTISALPFYAQPALHNPLPTDRPFHRSIAYAGSYYGDRYKERSSSLKKLLVEASNYPLEIYDRQASIPDSPYTFPVEYQSFVSGALPYQEVVKSYRTHFAHLNVNSVLNSPTMFSRRVVEIAACGGLVLSAYGRGIAETIGSNIAHSNSDQDHRAWLYHWTRIPSSRLEEIWRQMRTIYRSHTTESALPILVRTAGIAVRGLEGARYVAQFMPNHASDEARERTLRACISQSVPPLAVLRSGLTESEEHFLEAHGVKVLSTAQDVPSCGDVFAVQFNENSGRTWAEDVLLPMRFGEFTAVHVRSPKFFAIDDPVVEMRDEADKNGRGTYELVAELIRPAHPSQDNSPVIDREVVITAPFANDPPPKAPGQISDDLHGKVVVVAGHDLKFAQSLLAALEKAGAHVLKDEWESHTAHNESQSEELLAKADIVFCEWGLGNAVWYSQRVRATQKMFVRVHSQELFRPYLKEIASEVVDAFIFVGDLIRAAAVHSHGIPQEKTVVIPNAVNLKGLAKPKVPRAAKTLGMVGIVPQSKRLDRAVDILSGLLSQDPEYKLRIKGKTPEDYPWMKNRPEEMRYFKDQYRRIEEINRKYPGAVVFDGFGSDMNSWYESVGIVLSVSDFESFHLTIADGAASGAVPFALNWPGADRIYPTEWLYGNTNEIVDAILKNKNSPAQAERLREAVSGMAEEQVLNRILRLIAQ
ncbi:glycosyltransferase [Corynebacterium mayonis]|uniref:glycosyltransferase n=1 Tax=Corynebacterium mayonis TaxID=3062461 RepID=UPI0031402E33